VRDNDNGFSGIIDAMGGTPPPLMPAPAEPTRKESFASAMKILGLSLVLFGLQTVLMGLFLVGLYSTIAHEFGLTQTSVSFVSAWIVSMFTVVIVSTLRRATA